MTEKKNLLDGHHRGKINAGSAEDPEQLRREVSPQARASP